MRSLPGGFRRTMAVKRPAKTTATAPPPIARRTLESICLPFPNCCHCCHCRLQRHSRLLRTRGWLHRRPGECLVEAVDFHARDDEDPVVAALLGVIAGAVEAL